MKDWTLAKPVAGCTEKLVDDTKKNSERCFIFSGRASSSSRGLRRTSFNSLRTAEARLMDRVRDVTVTQPTSSNLLPKSGDGSWTARTATQPLRAVGGLYAGPIDTTTHRSLIGSRLVRQRDVITATAAAAAATLHRL